MPHSLRTKNRSDNLPPSVCGLDSSQKRPANPKGFAFDVSVRSRNSFHSSSCSYLKARGHSNSPAKTQSTEWLSQIRRPCSRVLIVCVFRGKPKGQPQFILAPLQKHTSPPNGLLVRCTRVKPPKGTAPYPKDPKPYIFVGWMALHILFAVKTKQYT